MTSRPANSSRFSLAIHGIDESFRLTRLRGASAIGDLYEYDISCASKSQKITLEDLLNHSVLITIHDLTGAGAPRFLRGIISEAAYLNHGREYSEYQLKVVPTFWICTQKRGFRIFQDTSPNAIILGLLKEHGISGDLLQDRTQAAPKRPYCTQYGETDYEFITRLMAEEGWHFHFINTPQKQILVLADNNQAFAKKSGRARLRYEQESSRPQQEECVHLLHSQHQLQTGQIRLGDYQFEKPSLTLQETSAGHEPALEHYHFPGHFNEPGRGKALSQRYLEQSEYPRQIVTMETHSIHCESGQTFTLEKHPNAGINQRYLIIRSELEAEQPQSLDSGASNTPARCISRLLCIPYSTPYRPPWQFTRPQVPGPHNAIVTGPKGEEIYTDQHGRIKVQFYWDREGQANERTSCWLRVNQPIAGIQWGGISLPRIGQEVIVDFEHGDPDRPVMTGRVYNGQNLPPYPLPAHKTRSTLKSLSSPGGGGYHEVRLEDKKGSEQIFLRAEKDLDLRVMNDLKSQTDRDQHLTVANVLSEEIGKDLHSEVGANQNDDVGQTLSLSTGKDLQLKISGAHVVQSGNSIHIKVGSKAILQGGMSLSVKGGAGVITLDPSGVAILGPLVRINEGGGGGSAQSANPTRPGTPAEADNDRPGARIRAATGANTALPPAIDFERTRAQLATLQEAAELNSPFVEECPECALFAQQQAAAMAAAHEATSEAVSEAAVTTNTLDLICIDADGGPAANLPYRVTLADGSVRSGTLDANGQCSLDGLPPGTASVEYAEEVNEAELAETRREIAAALQEIVAAEEQEKAAIEAEYAKQGAVGQWWEEEKAKARGMGKSVVGLLSFLKEVNDLAPMNAFMSAHKVAWDSWRNTDDRPYLQRFSENLTESQFKEVADVLGFDPRSISREGMAEAWAMANFVWDDPETQKLLVEFGGDYVSAQHKLEILEFGAGAATEIAIDALITAATAGLGLAVAAGTKLHYLDKFKKLGPLFKKLAELRKKAFQRKQKAGQTGGEIPEQLDKPGVVEPRTSRLPPTPQTMDEVLTRMDIATEKVAEARRNGTDLPTSPFTTEDKLRIVEEGLQEKYIVRIIKTNYAKDTGSIGWVNPDTGRSTYWTTTYTQLEYADKDAELIAKAVGTDYDPKSEYTLLVIDAEQAAKTGDMTTFIPTYERLGELAKTDMPHINPEHIDSVMTPEYSATYEASIEKAKGYGFDIKSEDDMMAFAKNAKLTPEDVQLLDTRQEINNQYGANELFLGNGLTKDVNGSTSSDGYGMVETFTLDKKPGLLGDLEKNGVLQRVPLTSY
ncbi:MAG: type VI secretion system tip protein TssI/VgrG [Pseudomonadota bacterium]|nr:type VI secretion system tip protein TssI/VgrG [Pseudomonadota bacterium]